MPTSLHITTLPVPGFCLFVIFILSIVWFGGLIFFVVVRQLSLSAEQPHWPVPSFFCVF